MKTVFVSMLLGGCIAAVVTPALSAETQADQRTLERGRYLAVVGGCNDCHTPGYLQGEGKVSQAQWLTGNTVGFKGPWGTTYPANLRLLAQSQTEVQWRANLKRAKRPPMPWFNVRQMSDEDMGALYHFIRSLGAAGSPAPQFVPPGQQVSTPYYEFVPKNPPKQASAAE
jgi:mono/diheme cytochrome c family protein